MYVWHIFCSRIPVPTGALGCEVNKHPAAPWKRSTVKLADCFLRRWMDMFLITFASDKLPKSLKKSSVVPPPP